MADTKTSTKRSSKAKTSGDLLSDEERAAMQETIRERKKAAKRSPEEQRVEGEADVQAKIAEMPDEDRALAARIHEIVTTTVPDLVPRTFYGMPAYAKDGKVVCFFQAKAKFKVRYSTLGFQHDARLDEGADLAGRLRRDEPDPGGREADRRAGQEGCGLRLAPTAQGRHRAAAESAQACPRSSRKACVNDARRRKP